MTSRCFVATLPHTLADEQLDKLFAWTKTYCVRFDVVKDATGCMRILVARKEARSKRDFHRLLRTNIINYSVKLLVKMGGLLQVFDEREYEDMRRVAGGELRGVAGQTKSSAEASPRSPFVGSALLRSPVNLLAVK